MGTHNMKVIPQGQASRDHRYHRFLTDGPIHSLKDLTQDRAYLYPHTPANLFQIEYRQLHSTQTRFDHALWQDWEDLHYMDRPLAAFNKDLQARSVSNRITTQDRV